MKKQELQLIKKAFLKKRVKKTKYINLKITKKRKINMNNNTKKENEKFFAITSLISTDKLDYFPSVIKSFLENCNYRPLKWYIFNNGSSQNVKHYLNSLNRRYEDVEFIVKHSDKNLGCGAGVNRANNLVREYKYVLFLEDDWIHLPNKIVGTKETWLKDVINFMENQKDCDFIYLRKIKSETETIRGSIWYGYHPELFEREKNGYIKLTEAEYTNNPHLRRNDALYEKEVLPLIEFFDENGCALEIKGNKEWGLAELKAKRVKNFWINSSGPFSHEDLETKKYKKIGCGKYRQKGISTCKYNYIEFTNGEHSKNWCLVCNMEKNKKYIYLKDNNEHFKRHLLTENDEKKLLDVRNKINPTVPLSYDPTK